MDRFDLSGAELQVGGLALSLLAERVGQTPFYAYDRALIAARIAAVRQVLPAGVHLHYAIKANPMPALVGFVRPLVDGMDVASAAELRLALDAGADPQGIGFAGPGKREAELRQAVASGVLLHVESARELHLLADAAQFLGRGARVALRINPDYPHAIEYQGEAFLGLNRLHQAKFNYLRLYAIAPALADKLLRAMRHWIEQNSAKPPDGVDAEAFAAWVATRPSLPENTKQSGSW